MSFEVAVIVYLSSFSFFAYYVGTQTKNGPFGWLLRYMSFTPFMIGSGYLLVNAEYAGLPTGGLTAWYFGMSNLLLPIIAFMMTFNILYVCYKVFFGGGKWEDIEEVQGIGESL